ncbi:Zinc finger protein [Oopsacas minuta]|uniref:Zinc finger protein n=1 Tax=Oopsacas minuta TaxID=111878 RepID=A0AAV7KKN1_9METZ|nr:Zinc finger protein [Oopsacas minuta]
MYFLEKQETLHTINFADLKELYIQLGNKTLLDLVKGNNANYQSEQIMAELVQAIGDTPEEKLLEGIKKSPYNSLIMDEATDISVIKQHELCVQYLVSDAEVQTRNLKLLEVSQGTTDIITDSIENYLIYEVPMVINLSQLAGSACNGASVMVGAHSGVIIRLKGQVPNFITTHCAAH